MVKVVLVEGFPGRWILIILQLLDSGEASIEESEGKKKARRKPLPATYEPDKRTAAWIKLKKDYVTGIGDTLDLIPIGAWHGSGRKVQWWSPILLALWDPDTGRPVAVSKCMSGTFYLFLSKPGTDPVKGSPICSTKFVTYLGIAGYSLTVRVRHWQNVIH
jgi:DNA ligase-1